MKKKIFAVALAFVLVAVSAVAVAATTGGVNISGDSLSVTAANVTLSAVTLDGTDQTPTSASGSNSWTAKDPTGTGAGWNLTISATDFVGTAGGETIDISAADSNFKIQLLNSNVTVTAGNTKPVSQVTSLTAIPTTGEDTLKFLSAVADTGMGTYAIAPNFQLGVPAETYAAADYTSTITVSIVSGP